MSSPLASEGPWHPVDYDSAWKPFYDKFDFKPEFAERSQPAIDAPTGSLVIGLSSIFSEPGPVFAASESAINAAALRAFVHLAGDEDLVALDWQHGAYRYSPASHAVADLHDWPVPVFPNGDYYVHAAANLSWGTFGHPWQQTLTLWGAELIRSLGTELLTWLPRHEHSST
ncbi:DUF2716 domain-containing protein [Cellulomonas rhizosphaerae]|uniref:DUF2716 domain-containing protein n=1 Tax=Cellulomonas rhizosphaerae TaxID=2293719 RepID=A0A413RHB4_9CELL|nr:DUF2716 domain-containing protein [Cellulomonas rhizosphaerae]RHA37538.1 DUF2716 domain-containing protein [Cellulomonas rhizosphaerae]